MKQLMIILVLGLIVLPLVSADIIFETIDETSGVVFNNNLDIELKEALVDISFDKDYGSIDAYFKVYSNEDENVPVVMYFKAKGEDCYGGDCNVQEFAYATTNIKIASKKELSNYTKGYYSACEYYYDDEKYWCDFFLDEYTLSEGNFVGIEFNLPAKEEVEIYVDSFELTLPFYYYLDSLSTFQKADYEKITITGENLNVKFNEYYPVNKISDSEFVWEYSNIDVDDPNIKDVLIITRGEEPEPTPKPSPEPTPEPGFFSKIWNWFKNLF